MVFIESYLFWLIVTIILTILEVTTVNLVSVWFIISGIVSLIASFIYDSFILEFTIFVIGGIILMLITKPLLDKKLKRTSLDYLDLLVGKIGKVTEPITPDSIGEVYVDGKRWSAIADEEIKKDESVVVLSLEGVKLRVRKEK